MKRLLLAGLLFLGCGEDPVSLEDTYEPIQSESDLPGEESPVEEEVPEPEEEVKWCLKYLDGKVLKCRCDKPDKDLQDHVGQDCNG
jgi:hypothetical protein